MSCIIVIDYLGGSTFEDECPQEGSSCGVICCINF